MGHCWPTSTRERPLNVKAVTPLTAEKQKEEKNGKPDNYKLQDVLPGIGILNEKLNNVKGNVTKMQTLLQDFYASVMYDESQLKELSRLSNQIFSDSSQIREDANRLKAQYTNYEGVREENAHNRVVLTQSGRVSYQKGQTEHKYETTTTYQRVLANKVSRLRRNLDIEGEEVDKLKDRIEKVEMQAENVQWKKRRN